MTLETFLLWLLLGIAGVVALKIALAIGICAFAAYLSLRR